MVSRLCWPHSNQKTASVRYPSIIMGFPFYFRLHELGLWGLFLLCSCPSSSPWLFFHLQSSPGHWNCPLQSYCSWLGSSWTSSLTFLRFPVLLRWIRKAMWFWGAVDFKRAVCKIPIILEVLNNCSLIILDQRFSPWNWNHRRCVWYLRPLWNRAMAGSHLPV